MKTEFWLIVNSGGSVHVRKTRPALDANEVSVKLNLSLPDALFQRPQLQADVSIDPDQVQTYPMETAIVQNIKDAVKQATGMDLAITVVDPNEEEELEHV